MIIGLVRAISEKKALLFCKKEAKNFFLRWVRAAVSARAYDQGVGLLLFYFR
ncbi:MAG: hypothetical protein HIU90_00225 [Proteobacteria bacterium]|nr:hypothetical protein [Pseudomonadota bacterium]